MAELAMGAVGLLGVIGAFKDAIDLFDYFMSSREFGRDYEILDTKVDIERTVLLQWAEQVKLLRTDYDRRLDDPTTQHAVVRILGCIKLLMSDETKLRERYGLNKATGQATDDKSDRSNRVAAISSHRMAKFVEEFEALKLRVDIRDANLPLRKKIRWVIRDKAKFEILVSDLIHFTTKLTQIVPISDHQATARSATNKDISAITDLRGLKIIREASAINRVVIAELTREQITRTCEERVLNQLWFRAINERKESVSQAHEKTFHWVLESPKGYPWDDLSEWLRAGSGIYWVSGKAGSGKSTLMKYLVQHQRAGQLLSSWAGSTPCLVANYFFYNLGTPEQKSQEGLSRTLLYQILSANPSLIPEVLPNMWRQTYDSDGLAIDLPSVNETKHAFQILGAKTSQIGKFCFFIDGLDEFVGNYLDGIAFIKDLALNNDIKIVVSSRPIPDCVASFDGVPSLALHQLTRADIKAYVDATIGGHKYMQGLLRRHPIEAVDIMRDLVNKSSGVFLWVILACRSLISGFADYDRIQELKRRVDELPPELEEMFQHMLNGINKRHREQGSRLLRLCFLAGQVERGVYLHLPLLGLALVEEGCTNVEQITELDQDQKKRLCDELEGRLRSRTGGLLETDRGEPPFKDDGSAYCFCNIQSCHDTKVDRSVRFMHRTVFEFLSNEQVWNMECLGLPDGLRANSELSLVGLYLAMISVPGAANYDQASKLFLDGLEWGVQSDLQEPECKSHIFWAMQPFLNSLRSSPPPDTYNMLLKRVAKASESSFVQLKLAAETGAVNFVKAHASFPLENSSIPDSEKWSLLLYHAACDPLVDGPSWIARRSYGWVEMSHRRVISLLLSYGGKPNYELFDGATKKTPWLAWLEYTSRMDNHGSHKLRLANVAEVFLRSGAEPLEEFRDWVQDELLESKHDRVRSAGRKLLDLAGKLKSRSVDPSSRVNERGTDASGNEQSGGLASNIPPGFDARSPSNVRKREGDASSDICYKRPRPSNRI